jgi:hypothetical protein
MFFVRPGALLADLFGRWAFFVRGHAIIFVSPVAEVYELATFGAERTMRIVRPLDGLVADRTLLHKNLMAKRRKGGRGKKQ